MLLCLLTYICSPPPASLEHLLSATSLFAFSVFSFFSGWDSHTLLLTPACSVLFLSLILTCRPGRYLLPLVYIWMFYGRVPFLLLLYLGGYIDLEHRRGGMQVGGTASCLGWACLYTYLLYIITCTCRHYMPHIPTYIYTTLSITTGFCTARYLLCTCYRLDYMVPALLLC